MPGRVDAGMPQRNRRDGRQARPSQPRMKRTMTTRPTHQMMLFMTAPFGMGRVGRALGELNSKA